MSQLADMEPPYFSKGDFLAGGLDEIILDPEAAMVCSICREPLATLLDVDNSSLPRVTASQDTNVGSTNGANHSSVIGTFREAESSFDHPNDDPIPEPAVCIRHCGHVFGKNCLLTWFSTNSANRCPECNQTLFLNRHMHLTFHEPTLEMRIEFAHIVETMLGDVETAELIRQQLMSEWTKALMRELAIEIHRARGYEVTFEYLDVAVPDEVEEGENENDEDYFGEENENGKEGDEDGDEDNDDDEEDGWDGTDLLGRV